MSKLRDKLATIHRLADENVQEQGKTDEDFLTAIQGLGFSLNNPEQALRGQQWGKLGALDLLNTDGFFGQLLGYTNQGQAIDFIFQTIDTLDNGLSDFPQYNKLGEATKSKLKIALQKNRKVEDMAFTLSNFGLKGSGNGVVAEVEEELEKKASHSLSKRATLKMKKIAASFDSIIINVIKDELKAVAHNIGYDYHPEFDSGEVELVISNMDQLREATDLKELQQNIEEAVQQWAKDTEENYPELLEK